MVDLIYYNKPAGGICAAAVILDRLIKEGKFDIKKLIKYASRFPVAKTRKFIGMSLEKTGVSETLLKPLEKSVRNTALISFTNTRKGKINEKWGVICQ